MLNNKKRRWEGVLSVCLLALFISVDAQKRPPNYSQDDMPITSFSCHNRIVGGYYADPETDCQMFHVCVNVPGVGIQDFRFLCPNDTTFDQEHQICDDWYNIDCELSLYDSFDLYRIGIDNEIKKPTIPKKPAIANKGTPIPLGPSSTVRPLNVAVPKKNIYTSVNNGIGDDEDFYTKNGNAVSDESKVPHDILRGSHSSNFYDSKTRGREDLENDYVASNTGARKQEVSQPSDVKKHKTLVRKLASKRPVSQNNNQQNFNNVNYNSPQAQRAQQQHNQTEFATTASPQPKNRGNVNYNTYTNTRSQQQGFQDFQRIPPTGGANLYQKINNLTEENSSQERKQDVNRNYDGTNYNFRSQSKFRSSSKFTTAAAPVTTAQVRLPSTEYLQNIANNFQQPASVINNQLQGSGEYRKPAAVDYQAYYETTTSPELRKSTEFQSFYYHPNTTVFDYYKYYQTSTTTTTTPPRTTSYQQQKATTTTPKYDPYATFQKSNEKYDEEEFLKTAPSSNLKPSDLNTIYNQKKNAYINATLKAAYNIEPHKASYYQAIATSSSSSPRANYREYQTSTTASKNYYQTPTTTVQTVYKPVVPVVGSAPQNNYKQVQVFATTLPPPQNNYQQQNNYNHLFTTIPPSSPPLPQNNYYQYQSAATNAPHNNYFSSVTTNAPQNFYQPVGTSTAQNNYYRPNITTNPPSFHQNNFQQPTTATNFPQNNFYSSAAANSSPQGLNYQSAATNAPQNNYYQPVVTSLTKNAPVKQTKFATSSTPKSSPTNNQTHDYDYAYYDNGGGSSEYDVIDTADEDFARIKKGRQA